jgi:hypothetical protein
MRGRLGGRIGVPFGPAVGKAQGVFHLADVLLARQYLGWPIVRTAFDTSGRVAPALSASPAGHVQLFAQIKVNGGTLA